MSKKSFLVAIVVIIIMASTLFIAISSAFLQTPPTHQYNETTMATPGYVKPDVLIQAVDSGAYQAVNASDGKVINSSADASITINSQIQDNNCIALAAGTYVLTSTITKHANNVTIEGQGSSSVIFLSAPDFSAFTLSNAADWTIKSLAVNAGSENKSSGFYLFNCQNITIANCGVSNSYYSGITTLRSSNIEIDGNTVQNSAAGFGIAVWNTTQSTIANNRVDSTYWSGITVSDGSNYNVIFGNSVSRSGQNGALGDGIEIGSTEQSAATVGNLVSNNTCHDNVVDGISIAQSSLTVVSGNDVFNNGAAGIALETNSKWTQVIGNYVFNNSGVFLQGGGISASGAGTEHTTIKGNVVFNNQQNGIFLLENSSNSLISGNQVFDNSQKAPKVYDGIAIYSSNNRIENNTCFDDQSTITQRYGINTAEGFTNNTIVGNVFSSLQKNAMPNRLFS